MHAPGGTRAAASSRSSAPADAGKQADTAADIPKIYPVGSEVLVQVTKGPISTKGPRITTNLSLASRYLVLMPYSDQCGISHRQATRARPATWVLKELEIPETMGVIVRTVGEGQRARYFVRDLSLLVEQWHIELAMKEKPSPACVLPSRISSSAPCATF